MTMQVVPLSGVDAPLSSGASFAQSADASLPNETSILTLSFIDSDSGAASVDIAPIPSSGPPPEAGADTSPPPPGRTPRRSRRRVRVTPAVIQQVEAALGGGTPKAQVARMLGMSKPTVQKIAARPESKENIQVYREAARLVALRGLKDSSADAYSMLKEAISARDHKAFQLTANGLAHMEKIGASAAGDPIPIDSRVQVDSDIAGEVTVLLKALMGEIVDAE